MLMPTHILLIDTASPLCSVALSRDGATWLLRQAQGDNIHARSLTLFIQELLQTAQLHWTDIQAIALNQGPGSYTGLRIGAATVKALCYALNLPLIPLCGLQALGLQLLQQAQRQTGQNHYFALPLLDARRLDAYGLLLNPQGQTVLALDCYTFSQDWFAQLIDHHQAPLALGGDAADKFYNNLSPELQQHCLLLAQKQLSAQYLAHLAHQAYEQAQFADLAYFQPHYLKPPRITQAKPAPFA